MKRDLVVIIPAYEPRVEFIDYTDEIRAYTKEVVVIDDGSGDGFSQIFNRLCELPDVRVISYPKNRGKGYALKRGIKYCTKNHAPETVIVTADCDGQHTVEDILRVYDAAVEKREALVLGVRDFSGEDVPKRSRFGNKLSTGLFGLLFGKRISDTQTGLRAFSVLYGSELCRLKGNRFDYESSALIYTIRKKAPIIEVPIKTVYDEDSGSHSSHFKTIRDSLRVISALFRGAFLFLLSALFSCALDLTLFHILSGIKHLGKPLFGILASSLTSRVISSLFNYLMNLKLVFKGKSRLSIIKYYILALLQITASSLILQTSLSLLSVNPTVIKAIIDTILGILSYFVQNKWVFADSKTRQYKASCIEEY